MKADLGTEMPFGNVNRQISKMMDQLQKGYSNFYPGETWTPNVNLYETNHAYLVCVDLAGVEKDKIDVEIVDRQLTLRGTRAVPTRGHEEKPGGGPQRRMRVHLMEIDHGAFIREVELPPNVAKNHIQAAYRDGMLWIELPKTK